GTYYKSGTSSNFGYAMLESGGFNKDRKENFLNNVTATVKNVIKGLEVKDIYGRETDHNKNENFKRTLDCYSGLNENSLDRLHNPNSFSRYSIKIDRENFQAIADYSLTLVDAHNFHVMGGYQWEEYRYESLNASTKDLFVNENPSLNFTSDPI